MEYNIENKAKLFSQYWGQLVLRKNGNLHLASYGIINKLYDNEWLELKSVSRITDDDLKAIGFTYAKKVPMQIEIQADNYKFHWITEFGQEGYFALKDFDYLRSKGYALPWMGLSVEKQIEYGWIKLID